MRVLIIVLSIIFVICMIGTMMLYALADHIKSIQKFYCRIGWHCHSKDYVFDNFDGASEHCTCKWCGYKGMVDSQGNLF